MAKTVTIRSTSLRRGDVLPLAFLALAIFFLTLRYLDPRWIGIPLGLDGGADLSYTGPLRDEFLSGRLLTWWSTAYDGMPLLGHPLVALFYPPFTLPILALGTDMGLRLAYTFSLFLAATGIYFFARRLGVRPAISVVLGLVFVTGGTLTSRIFAGHVERVLAIPFIPWVLAAVFQTCQQTHLRKLGLWGVLSGLLTGITYLAGDAYLCVFFSIVVPLVMSILLVRSHSFSSWPRLFFALASWGLGLVFATIGKLVAGAELLANSARYVDPFEGSQDWYWSIVHLLYPFSSYGPNFVGRDLPRPEFTQIARVPGMGYGWWEYSQYIGIVATVFALGTTLAFLFSVLRHRRLFDGMCLPREIVALLAVFLTAAFWLADGFDYSPVHWLYLAWPPLQQFRVPSRALMLTAPPALVLAGIGLESLWTAERQHTWAKPVAIGALVIALVDPFLIDIWMLDLKYPDQNNDPAALVSVLRQANPGPLVVDLQNLPPMDASLITDRLARSGIALAGTMSPLVPVVQHHSVLNASRRVRYAITPQGEEPTTAGDWSLLATVGSWSVHSNAQARGDAWLIKDVEIHPLRLELGRPDMFELMTEATEGAWVVVPANAFRGWSVSIDGDAPVEAKSLDGYVAFPAAPGKHSYHFEYHFPYLTMVLVLAALPWIVGIWVIFTLLDKTKCGRFRF